MIKEFLKKDWIKKYEKTEIDLVTGAGDLTEFHIKVSNGGDALFIEGVKVTQDPEEGIQEELTCRWEFNFERSQYLLNIFLYYITHFPLLPIDFSYSDKKLYVNIDEELRIQIKDKPKIKAIKSGLLAGIGTLNAKFTKEKEIALKEGAHCEWQKYI